MVWIEKQECRQSLENAPTTMDPTHVGRATPGTAGHQGNDYYLIAAREWNAAIRPVPSGDDESDFGLIAFRPTRQQSPSIMAELSAVAFVVIRAIVVVLLSALGVTVVRLRRQLIASADALALGSLPTTDATRELPTSSPLPTPSSERAA
jgi:hypothetical protein